MRFRQSFVLLSVAALSACSAQVRAIPPAAATAGVPPAAAVRAEPESDAKGGYGVGLAATSYIYGPNISKSFGYCQTPGYQVDGCPGHMPGLTDDRFSFKRHDGPYLYVSNKATAHLGRFDFAQTAGGDSNPYYEIVKNYTTFHWTDTLHVTSQTLRAGTPVTFEVSLSLTSAGSSVDCNRLDASSGYLVFHGTGTDAYGERLNVQGFCYYPSDGYYGEFVYAAGSQYPTTPTDTGTIESKVGKSFKIGVIGTVNSAACGDKRYCSFENQSGLSGILSWKIESETNGADYTTDSGARYGGPSL